MAHDGAANPIQGRAYGYTPAGDIDYIADAASGITYGYYYDRLHRLIKEETEGPGPSVGLARLDYYYEDTDHSHGVSTIDLVSESNPAGTPCAFNYDANGNMIYGADLTDMTGAQSRSITFNADNMATQVTHSTGPAISLTYDGQAQRAKKSGTGGIFCYIDDTFEVVGGSPVKYIFANGQRIARISSSGTHYFHKDHLGSTISVTDASGLAVQATAYLPFGGKRGSSDITLTSYKYTDQEQDGPVNLYNYNARLYDPAIGAFVSADSIVPDAYNPQSLNRYAYVLNSPMMYVDPSGNLFLVDDAIGWLIGTFAGTRNDGFFEGVGQNFTESWKAVLDTFNTFENNQSILDFLKDIGELSLRLTWGLPNELIGNVLSYGAIEIFGGTTENYENVLLINLKQDFGAFGFGSKVIGTEDFLNDKVVASHEQGHYYQSLIVGPAYPFAIAAPSGIHAGMYRDSSNDYYDFYTERWANYLAGIKPQSIP